MRIPLPGAPARPTLVQLRPRRAEDEQRHALRPLGQVLQEREERFVSPVQVLEHEHRGSRGGKTLEITAPGREGLLPLYRRAASMPTSGASRWSSHCRSASSRRDRSLELRRRHFRRVGLEDRRLPLHDLAERPEGDSLSVRETASLAPADDLQLRVHVGEELGDQAALAHARLADDRDQLHRTLLRCARSKIPIRSGFSSSRPTNGVACSREVGAEADTDGLRTPERKRLRLPLHRRPASAARTRRCGSSTRYVCSATATPFTGAALSMRAAVLTTSPVTSPSPRSGSRAHRDDGLARVDPYAHVQVEVGIGLVQLRDRFEDAQPRAHRPLGVVLVRHGSAEGGHDRVTDELLDRAAVALDLLRAGGRDRDECARARPPGPAARRRR